MSTTRYLNFNTLVSFDPSPWTVNVASYSPKAWSAGTTPLDNLAVYLLFSLPVWTPSGKGVAVTFVGNPEIVTLVIFPELSHASSCGLKLAPLNTVKIGSPAVCPIEIPFNVAWGFALSAKLNVTFFLICFGA